MQIKVSEIDTRPISGLRELAKRMCKLAQRLTRVHYVLMRSTHLPSHRPSRSLLLQGHRYGRRQYGLRRQKPIMQIGM